MMEVNFFTWWKFFDRAYIDFSDTARVTWMSEIVSTFKPPPPAPHQMDF